MDVLRWEIRAMAKDEERMRSLYWRVFPFPAKYTGLPVGNSDVEIR